MWHGCTASESLWDMYFAPLLYYRNGLLQKQVVLIPYRKKTNKNIRLHLNLSITNMNVTNRWTWVTIRIQTEVGCLKFTEYSTLITKLNVTVPRQYRLQWNKMNSGVVRMLEKLTKATLSYILDSQPCFGHRFGFSDSTADRPTCRSRCDVALGVVKQSFHSISVRTSNLDATIHQQAVDLERILC